MKKLLNTLYVTTPETYLALDGENVVVLLGEEEKQIGRASCRERVSSVV